MKNKKNNPKIDTVTIVINRLSPRPAMTRGNQERDPFLIFLKSLFNFEFKKTADFGGKEIWGNLDKGVSIVAETDKIIISFLGTWWIRKKAFNFLVMFLKILNESGNNKKIKSYSLSRLDIKYDIEQMYPTFLFSFGKDFGTKFRFKKFSKKTAFNPVQIYGTFPQMATRATLYNSRFQFQIYKKFGTCSEQISEKNLSKKKHYENLYRGKEICRIELKLKYSDSLKKYLPLFFHLTERQIVVQIFQEWAVKNEYQYLTNDFKWEAHKPFADLFYDDLS